MSDTTRTALEKLSMTKEDGTDPNEERIQKLESENSELKNQLKVKDDIN